MRRLLVAVGVSALAVGCSTSSSTTDVSTPVAACNSFVTAGCNKASSCSLLGTGVTISTCITTAEAAASCSTTKCATGTTYDSAAATTCINNLNAQSCTDFGNNVTPTGCAITSLCH